MASSSVLAVVQMTTSRPRILSILSYSISGEDQLLLDAQAVVAAAVKGVGVDAAEVADAGQGHVEQAVQELPHAVAAQGDLRADGHTLTQLEVSHGLLGLGNDGLLAGDLGQIAHNGLQNLGVVTGLAAAAVDHDLVDLGGSA